MKTLEKMLRKPIAAIIFSLLSGLIVGAIVLAISGYNPLMAYKSLFLGIFAKPKSIVNSIIISTPIILTGLSVAFAYKTGLFNIGAEGQYLVGCITAFIFGYFVKLPPVIHFFFVIIMAMVVAGLYGGIVGLLKAKFGIHEVITSIMLNWIALYFNNYLIYFPGIKKPGTEASHELLSSAWCVVGNKYKNSEEGFNELLKNDFLRETFLKTDLNYGIIVAIVAAIGLWFLLTRTRKGLELRSVGLNPDASEFAGINVKRNIIHSMVISGAISGLAGAINMTGINPHRLTMLAMSPGYGFDGITVSLIANSNPIGTVFSGLLFGGLKYGGRGIQADIGAPSEVINIMMGTIVFFTAMSSVMKIIADQIKKRGNK